MSRCRFLRRGSAVLLVLFFAPGALAGPPTEQLKPQIDRVIKTLEDAGLRAEERTAERRQAIRRITNPIFDWTEMARRSLGQHWQGRTKGEREEFVKLFRELVEQSYISTIERYSGENIAYLGDAIDGDQATVRTKVVTKQGREVPIVYRMSRQGDRWLIYDVLVDSVSLVSNYRTQFNAIIRTSSYEGLVEKMRNRELGKTPKT